MTGSVSIEISRFVPPPPDTEFGKRADHPHHHAPGRRGGVESPRSDCGTWLRPRPSAPQWPARPAVSARAGRVSTPPAHRPGVADPTASAVRAGPSARGLLAIDTLALGRFQRSHLRRGVLFVGGDASVADQHCANLSPMILVTQPLFATHNVGKTLIVEFRCVDVPFCNPHTWPTTRLSRAASTAALVIS
jgi:hypothetical protein